MAVYLRLTRRYPWLAISSLYNGFFVYGVHEIRDPRLVFTWCLWAACRSERENSEVPAQSQTSPWFGALSVTPSSGAGADQLVHLALSRAAGTPMPVLIGLLVSDRVDGSNAFYLLKDSSANTASLVADSRPGAMPLGIAGSVANQQSELLKGRTKNSTPSRKWNSTSTFRAKFHEIKRHYLVAEDANGAGPSLKAAGEWTVP